MLVEGRGLLASVFRVGGPGTARNARKCLSCLGELGLSKVQVHQAERHSVGEGYPGWFSYPCRVWWRVADLVGWGGDVVEDREGEWFGGRSDAWFVAVAAAAVGARSG